MTTARAVALLSTVVLIGWLGGGAARVQAAAVEPTSIPPRLLLPASGSVLSAMPRLSWAPDPLAIEYSVEISTSPTFDPSTLGGGSSTKGTSWIPPNLGPRTYWWRVTGQLVTNQAGAPSTVWSFRILPSLSTAPILREPADGAAFAYPTSDLVLRWDPVGGAGDYEVEFASDAAFTVHEDTFRTGRTAVLPTINRDLINAPVHWRVRALRPGGAFAQDYRYEAGPWSAARTYTLGWSDAPVPKAPADSASVTKIVAEWTPVLGAAGYDLEWTDASDPGFTSSQVLFENVPFGWIPAPSGSTAIWRVRAYISPDPAGAVTTWSPVESASVDAGGDLPGSPVPAVMPQVSLTGPVNGVTVTAISDLPLTWTAVPEAMGYQVQFVPAGVAFAPAPVTAEWPYNVMTLDRDVVAGESFDWHVRAIGGDLTAGPWSETRELTVAADASPATPVSPADGVTVASPSVVFSWTGSPLAPVHGVELSRTPDFAASTPGLGIVGNRTEFTLTAGLWYWRVWSTGYPATTVSATRTFTVTDPDPPIFRAVLDGGTGSIPDGRTVVNLASDVEDQAGVATAVRTSYNGTDWTATPMPDARSLSLPITTPEAGGTAPGRRDVWVEWQDDSGNVSAPVRLTAWYAMTPPNVPDPPTAAHAIADAGGATVSWAAPGNDGGSPVTGYLVSVLPAGAGCSTTGTTACTVTGLAPGTAYTFRVSAENLAGLGAISAASNTVKPTAPASNAPVAHLTALATYQNSTSFTVAWGATPGISPVISYDVRVHHAAWNGSFGGYTSWRSGTTATSASFAGVSGSTYCFGTRAHDLDGLVSAWTTETCTATPLDDRRLVRSASWTLATNAADFAGTNERSTASGASLTRTGVVARSIALLVTTCPTCGSVRVYLQGVLVKTISLTSTTTVHRRLITVVVYRSTHPGTLLIRVVGSGRPVIVDGVVIRRI